MTTDPGAGARQVESGRVPWSGRVVGVDLGSRRIGVAVSDGAQRLATGVTAIARTGDDSAAQRALRALVEEYGAVGVVVGLPRSLSGALGPAAQRALAEVELLRGALGIAVDTVDERLSTVTASSGLRAGGRSTRQQRTLIDQTAAAVLLQSWLDIRSQRGGGHG